MSMSSAYTMRTVTDPAVLAVHARPEVVEVLDAVYNTVAVVNGYPAAHLLVDVLNLRAQVAELTARVDALDASSPLAGQ